MTSNLGGELLRNLGDDEDSEIVREQVMEIVRTSFRPEFLNRLDETVLFHRLGRVHLARIVDIQLEDFDGVALFVGDLLENRGDHLARTAPLRRTYSPSEFWTAALPMAIP